MNHKKEKLIIHNMKKQPASIRSMIDVRFTSFRRTFKTLKMYRKLQQ